MKNVYCQGGYSLIELLVSQAIGVFLIAAVLLYMRTSSQAYLTTSQLSQLQENGRSAKELILGSHRQAGYLGLYSKVDGSINVRNASSSDDTCLSGSDDWLKKMEQPIFGLNNSMAGYDCLTSSSYANNSDVLVTRSASVQAVAAIPADLNWYIRSSISEVELFRGDQPSSIVDPPFASFKAVAKGYFVGISDSTCLSNPIPSLFSISTDEMGHPIIQELIPGIEKLDALYLHNGQYKSADQLSGAEWQAVTAIKIWVLARSVCPDYQLKNSQTYSLPSGEYPLTPDGYYRQLFVGSVSVRNLNF